MHNNKAATGVVAHGHMWRSCEVYTCKACLSSVSGAPSLCFVRSTVLYGALAFGLEPLQQIENIAEKGNVCLPEARALLHAWFVILRATDLVALSSMIFPTCQDI